MDVHDGWRMLCVCDAFEEACTIVTSIAAMEFEVRLVDAVSGRPMATDEDVSGRGPFHVETREEDWDDLREVLDEVVEEQAEFDAALAARDHTVLRVRRVLLLAIIVIVSLLALFGVVEL